MSFNQDLKTQIRTFVAVALAVGVGVVGANSATAAFDDVPAEGQFAESISRVQEAGIATGFNDGSFRPTNALNRQQAAAWLDRSASRVGLDINGGEPTGPTLNAANPTAVLSTMEMTSPAAEGGSGWVTIQGGVGGIDLHPGATCPCPVDIQVLDDHDNILGRSRLLAYGDPTGEQFAIAPILAVTPIAGGETRTFRIVATLVDTSDEVLVGAAVYAQYAPLANGDPAGLIEAGRGDTVESMVPDLP
jgi:hypothetical protein